jgi:hypothetical protein
MMNNRADKIKLLDKAFNEGDISGVEDATKKPSIVLDIRQDEGIQRQETATFGNGLTLWNYNEDEAETVRKKLLTQYQIVWVTEFDN